VTALARNPGLEALADAFCMVDADWRITYWNAAAERWFGVSRQEALGRAYWEVLGGAADSLRRETLAAAVYSGEPVDLVHASADGARCVGIHAVPLEEGGVAIQMRDASGERRLGERYSRLLETIRDGFVAVDTDWRVVYLNGAARTLLGLKSTRAVGLSLLSFLPESPSEVSAAIRGTMDDGTARHLRAVRPEGKLFRGRRFDVWVEPLAGGGISILFEDVSDRIARETELARLAAEAEEANRAKSRFFAAVSHELRTPLHAIVGYTHLLSTGSYGDIGDGATRAAERSSVCAEHLARLIDDVLLLTTTEIDKLPVYPSPLRVGRLLPELLEQYRIQAEAKGLEFHLDLPDGLPEVETDPERLRQLLQALVSNAVKFTSRGGVRVSLRAVEAAERPRDLREGSPAGERVPALEMEVADTGPGIAPEDRARIFEVFEQVGDDARTDSVNRGTGLGLTIARQMARLLGGTLEVDSEPGAGSTFRARLPLQFGRAVA
jgi:PAS domain S-box-containing protein